MWLNQQRLDIWLYHARIFKSRSGAQTAIESGLVAVNGQTQHKPAHVVKVGDSLVVFQERSHRWLSVAGIGARRGPPTEAQALYTEEGRRNNAAPTPFIQKSEPDQT